MKRITKMSETVFRFECETKEEADIVQGMKEFEHESKKYLVRSIVECFDTPGYYSFVVSIK